MKDHSLRVGSENLSVTRGRLLQGRNVQSNSAANPILAGILLAVWLFIREARKKPQVVACGAEHSRQAGMLDAMRKGQLTRTCCHSLAGEVTTCA